MSRSSRTHRTSTYDTIQWLISLSENGYNEFKKKDIPKNLINNYYFRTATARGFLTIKNTSSRGNTWEINYHEINTKSGIPNGVSINGN